MMCEPQAGHWTSKHTGNPWDAFGQPYTRTRHKAGVACSQRSVISTGLPLSFYNVFSYGQSFLFLCTSTGNVHCRACACQLMVRREVADDERLDKLLQWPATFLVAPEKTVTMTTVRIEEGQGHRGRFLVTKMSTRRMARSRSFSDVIAKMVSWALFSRGSTAKSHQHHAGPLGFPWKHRRKIHLFILK